MKTKPVSLRWLALAASAAVVVPLVGCSPSATTPEPTSSGPTSSATTSEPTVPTGGTAVVGIILDADTLLPWQALKVNTVKVVQLMYDSLTRFDKDMNTVPGLAESWDVSPDGLTVTFSLREGVTFADGTALDSGDVKYSLELIKNPENAAIAVTDLQMIESIETPDPQTVVLTLSSPDAALPTNLAPVTMSIVPEGSTAEDLGVLPNGTGAFAFESRTPNQSITLVRNASYWGERPPSLDKVEFRIIPDESSLAAAVQSGNVDIVAFDDPLVAKTVTSAEVEVIAVPQQLFHAIILNSRSKTLQNLDVRLAIQCAVDRQEVLDAALLGEGQLTGPVTTSAFRSDPSARPCPEVDLERARGYLASAGVPDGFTMNMVVSQDLYASGVDEAQVIQQQLAKIGITVELEILESGAYVERWRAPETRDAVLVLAGGGSPDPDALYGRYFTSTGSLNGVAGFSSDNLDKLFAQGKAESDHAARVDIYHQFAREVEDNAAWIWMFTGYSYVAVSSELTGFTAMTNGSLQYLAETSRVK